MSPTKAGDALVGARLTAFRVVLAAWLFGWFVNAPGFWDNFRDGLAVPMHLPTLPRGLCDERVAMAFYVIPIVGLAALFAPRAARAVTAVLVVCALGALLHGQTGSDATFLTSFWSATWLAWTAHGGGRDDDRALVHGRALAQAIVGTLFLGAAIGKLTPEFEGGQAFYELYFRHNGNWPYPWLRRELAVDSVRGLATAFSRCAIAAELVLAGAPLWPSSFVLSGVAVTALAMMTAWTFHLASVLSSVVGLAVAAYLLDRELARRRTRGSRARG